MDLRSFNHSKISQIMILLITAKYCQGYFITVRAFPKAFHVGKLIGICIDIKTRNLTNFINLRFYSGKGQTISKANDGVLNSPKKRTLG